MEHDLTAAREKIEEGWRYILEGLEVGYGLNYKNDENFDETPARNARALLERCVGINSQELCKDLLGKTFPSEYTGIIMINPTTIHSLCPHHFEDVYYEVIVAYMPKGRCVGISKIPRMIKLLGSQPILQEDLTKAITDTLMDHLDAAGVMVVTKAIHNCMVARGVKEPGVRAVMSEVRGLFLTDPNIKLEFYKMATMAMEQR